MAAPSPTPPSERGMARAAHREVPAGSVRSLFEVKHYALVVGINAYDAQVGPLSGAVADARAVASVLSDERRTDRFEVTLLLDAEATRDGIRAAFQALRARLERAPDARVLIYYAGHGVSATASDDVSADTPGYFLPQDARVGDAGTYLSMAEVREALDALPCHHLLLVLDCCFAGAFRWLATRAAAPSPRKLYEERVRRYMRDRAWHVITSAAHDEKALDAVDGKLLIGGKRDEAAPEDVHGARSPFAVALVKALRGEADSPVAGKEAPDGVITGSEIHVYIANLFGAWGEKGARRFQVPLFFHWPTREGSKGEFVFLNPAEALRLERAVELVAANNPYRGLAAYAYEPRDPKQPARRQRLFGRDALTRELVAKAEAQPVVAVLGASGSGKSSAVCAGLLPALEDVGWRVVAVVRPGDDPARALRALAVALDADSPEGEALAAAAARCPGARLVAVVDQLEELVTLRRGEDGREAFFGAVDAAVAASGGRLRVVYTLRSDFEPHFTQLIARHPEGRVRVPSMGMDELRAVIQLPAEERVFSFDPPSLVDEIAREVVDAPGALPLVSFTLSEMYLRYARAFEGNLRDDRVLTREDYNEVGGVEGSLSRQADRVYEGLPDDASREALRRVMLRAVTLEGGLPARRRVPASELAYADASETARARRALDALTAARLMVGGEQDGAAYAEPAHDKFVLGWTRLRGWIDAPGERERMDAHRLLREKTADWVRLKREGGWLDRDARLDHWTELLAGALNADEAALLEGSARRRREEAEREKRRVKELEEALVRARDHALMSAVREKAHDATTQVALLREVKAPAQVPRWEKVAREALLRPDVALAVFGCWGKVSIAEFSPDGAYVVTASDDYTARVYRTDGAGEPVVLRGHENRVLRAAFSPDGAYVVTASADYTARVWRADGTGEPVVLRGHDGHVLRAAFSPDGVYVVTASGDYTARVWRADGTSEPVVLGGTQ
ncbi:MAG: caspase family protein [Polyangiales bacterium]